MDGEMEGSFSPVIMEVWSSSASEEEEEEKSTFILVDEVVEEERKCFNSNNNNNNNNSDSLCREVTQGEIKQRVMFQGIRDGRWHAPERSMICRAHA